MESARKGDREEGVAMSANCQCPETSALRAKGQDIPPLHDCAYTAKRNGYVIQAALYADGRIRKNFSEWGGAPDKHDAWSEIFFRRMEELMREAK